MTTPAFEAFLARLYTDDELRGRFLHNPERVASEAGLTDDEVAALQNIDREGLQLASRSFATKRAKHRVPRVHLSWMDHVINGIHRLISRLQ
ncbi:MAG: hypothetical protein JNK87_23155 [Bryobacterales bacterium]|nr:hypothetical protein [Bryobacterales bacterium]